MDEKVNTIFKLMYNVDAPKIGSIKWILFFFGSYLFYCRFCKFQ